jgi:hypothetical protein
MSTRTRSFLAASCALLVLLAAAAPAYSGSEGLRSMGSRSETVSPSVDVLLLRPVAFVTLVAGAALFVASLPIIVVTRPHEIRKPFERLVLDPVRYIWVDPLGSH